MANETTTTTLNDVVYSYVIEPTFLDYAHDWIVATPFFRRFSLVGKPSNVLQVPRLATNMGTVGDGGGGVDAEFDATEGTDLSTNTALSTDNVQFTAAEYGLVHKITDNVREDSILGGDMSMYISNAARILTTAVEDSALALPAGLSNSVGSSGVDLTIAEGSFFAMLGPSGSGKTSLIRTVNALERLDRGEERIAAHA